MSTASRRLEPEDNSSTLDGDVSMMGGTGEGWAGLPGRSRC
jgi:hypothetical protein